MIEKRLSINARKTDQFLKTYLNNQKNTSLTSNEIWGFVWWKKVRSSIILNTGKLFDLSEKNLINLCGAVESIHSYSLIHDDLPCMG